MSRSVKKIPIVGITTCCSERHDKKIWHKRWRARERTALTRPPAGILVKKGHVQFLIPINTKL